MQKKDIAASAASAFAFNGSMSEETLKSYLARAVTFQGLCAESKDENLLLEEDIRMLLRTGTKFVSRAALFAWTATHPDHVSAHFQYAERAAKQVHAADPEIILQAFVAEIVRKSYVERIAIPSWVFEAFGDKPETRNFRYLDIIDTSSKYGANYWGTDAGYPDYSKQECLYWYYYCIRRYIDIGYESIHIQEHQENKPSQLAQVDRLLTMSREYAKTKARRGLVLFHSFFSMTGGGAKIGDRLLFDIQGNGLVPNETEKVTVNGQTVLKCRISAPYQNKDENYWCTWFGRSTGGQHPLGFNADICPTILELDNYGQQGPLGVSNGEAFGTWGYDDITWFAVQPEWYRNEFLLYLDEYMRTHSLTKRGKQAYFPVYPMRRVITAEPDYPTAVYKPGKAASIDFIFDYADDGVQYIESLQAEYNPDDNTYLMTSRGYYRANRQSDGCPNGFNQEDTIRRIFLGKDAPEDPRYDTVVLPAQYRASATGTTRPSAAGTAVKTKTTEAKRNTTARNDVSAGETGTTEPAETSAHETAGTTNQTGAPTQTAFQSLPKKRGFPWAPVLITGAVILVGGGAAAVWLYKRYRTKAAEGTDGNDE